MASMPDSETVMLSKERHDSSEQPTYLVGCAGSDTAPLVERNRDASSPR